MTDDGYDTDEDVDLVGAPVDFDRLDLIKTRLRKDDRFSCCEWRPEYAPNKIVFQYDSGYYPISVTDACLEIVWFENEDFSIHYHETHKDGSFHHRWDRHPSTHNARDHVHPGPDAPTPGEDETFPEDWRDVLSAVLSEIENRQKGLWSR